MPDELELDELELDELELLLLDDELLDEELLDDELLEEELDDELAGLAPPPPHPAMPDRVTHILVAMMKRTAEWGNFSRINNAFIVNLSYLF